MTFVAIGALRVRMITIYYLNQVTLEMSLERRR